MFMEQLVEKIMDRPLSLAVENNLQELIGKEQYNEPPDIVVSKFVHDKGVTEKVWKLSSTHWIFLNVCIIIYFF